MEPGDDAVQTYTVVISYREPTYELRRGAPSAPYRTQYKVKAGSADQAVWVAIGMFEKRANASSVWWTRKIDPEGIQVQLEEG